MKRGKVYMLIAVDEYRCVFRHKLLPPQKLLVTLQSKHRMRNDQEYHNDITAKAVKQ